MKNNYYERNKLTRLKRGKEVERIFTNILNEKWNYSITAATKYQDIYEHFDIKFTSKKDNKTIYYIDIKGRNWLDGKYQDKYIWLELVNNYGFAGWVFTCSADTSNFAFEFEDHFLVIESLKVRDWINNYVDMNKVLRTDSWHLKHHIQDIYKAGTYNRYSKTPNDRLCLIHYNDLLELGAIRIDKLQE